MSLAKSLLDQTRLNILERNSPIYCSAQGVIHYLSGNHEEAVRCFGQAMEERKKWPPKIREYHWFEDARDLYFQSMAHYELCETSEENKMDDSVWKEPYKQAERLYENGYSKYLDQADIIDRVRNKAKETLEVLKKRS